MFSQLNKKIRKYFGISRSESNGIVVLILVMIFLVILPIIYRHFDKERYKNYEKDLFLMDSLSGFIFTHMEDSFHQGLVGQEPIEVLKEFDPNEISFNDMIRMGFDTLLTRRILSYRNKGGRFRKNEDLLKIYDFPMELYDLILPHIRLKEVPAKPVESRIPDVKQAATSFSDVAGMQSGNDTILIFDLNEADTSRLVKIRGIGPVLSGRIIRYRNLLGGYIHRDQLDEVYGLNEEALENLKQAVYVDSLFKPSTIRINFSEWQELVKHPYIESTLANKILDIRSRLGPYLDGRDFIERLSLPDSLSRKIIPYLQF
jgi:DNA uptake protein ComE-like DNA-binding protein